MNIILEYCMSWMFNIGNIPARRIGATSDRISANLILPGLGLAAPTPASIEMSRHGRDVLRCLTCCDVSDPGRDRGTSGQCADMRNPSKLTPAELPRPP